MGTLVPRVFIIDDQALFREALALALAARGRVQIAGQCSDASAYLNAFSSGEGAGIVLLNRNLDLRRRVSHDFLVKSRAHGCTCRTVVLADSMGTREAQYLLDLGAAGIFLTQHPLDILLECIRQVAAGMPWVDPSVASKAVEEWRAKPGKSPVIRNLTDRERAVLAGVCQGLRNGEIAARYHYSLVPPLHCDSAQNGQKS